MINRACTFSVIQIISVILSFFVLALAVAGSHGNLYFSNIGGTVAFLMTIILSVPLLYLFAQRKKIQNKNLSFIIATTLFSLALTAIYIGVPNMTKQFVIDKSNIHIIPVYKDNDLKINLELQPEMFNRVGIEVNINKASGIEFKKFNLEIYNNKGKTVSAVFRSLLWDSLHNEPMHIDSFFEINAYSKMNKFSLSSQYPIEDTDSLKIKIDYAVIKNGQTISNNKQFQVRIANHLTLKRFIEY